MELSQSSGEKKAIDAGFEPIVIAVAVRHRAVLVFEPKDPGQSEFPGSRLTVGYERLNRKHDMGIR
jgi:hypothetical protein